MRFWIRLPLTAYLLGVQELHRPRWQHHHRLVRSAFASDFLEGQRRIPAVCGTWQRLSSELFVLYGPTAACERTEVAAAVSSFPVSSVAIHGVFVTGNAFRRGLFLRLRGEVERVVEVGRAVRHEGLVIVTKTSGVVLTSAAIAAAHAAVAVVVVVDESLVYLGQRKDS